MRQCISQRLRVQLEKKQARLPTSQITASLATLFAPVERQIPAVVTHSLTHLLTVHFSEVIDSASLAGQTAGDT